MADGHHEEEHEEHVNHEAWVIPYADVLTLLMALFLVLFALGRSDQEKLEIAAASFRQELGTGPGPLDLGIGSGGAGPLASGAASVLDGAGPAPIRSDLDEDGPVPPTTASPSGAAAPDTVVLVPDEGPIDDPLEMEENEIVPIEEADELLGDPLTVVEQTVRSRAVSTGLADSIALRREERGLVVTIVTDQVLFLEGNADVQPGGFAILDVVAEALMELPNQITIEGHTDDRPISTARFPSNWELSTARATSVLRYLIEVKEFPRDRLSAAGYADTQPVDPDTTAEARAKNRRVEIVVLETA